MATPEHSPKRATPWREEVTASRVTGTWGAIAVFALLSVILTWPVVANLSSRIPGTATWAFDESTFVWNIWYFKHALLDLHISPLHTGLIWFPLGIDLVVYTYNFFNALLAMPLQLAFNLPLSSNATLLFATALSGFGAYLLALDVLREMPIRQEARLLHLAALISGLVFAFASNRAVYAALGHYNMVTTQWLPFYTLYLIRTLRRPSIRNAGLAGLFFALAALADMIFAAFLTVLSVVILLTLWGKLRRRRNAIARILVSAGVAVVLWSPVLVPIVRGFADGGYASEGWGESVKLSADLIGLETPSDLNPLMGNDATGAHWTAVLRAVEEGKARFSDVNTVFLGFATVLLAALGAWWGRKRARTWIWTALTFGVFALGPLLQINGRWRFSLDGLLPEGVTFPLPFTLLHFIPFINANRAPNRNGILLMMALAVLSAIAVTRILSLVSSRLHGRSTKIWTGVVTVLIGGAVLVEHLAVPLPTTDARIPQVYSQIASESGDFAIMQLPLGWRDSYGVLGSEQTQLQYYQTLHEKPIIGGNISRAPDFKMEYFARIPLFKALTDIELYQEITPELDAAARAQAGDLMSLYDIRYLVTTPPIAGRYPYQDTWRDTEAYALDVLPLEPDPVWEADGYRVYRVIQPPVEFPFRLDLGVSGIEAYVGAGFDLSPDEQPYGSTANWVTDRTADLFLPLAQPEKVTLQLAIAPLTYDGAPPQLLSVDVNGTEVLSRSALASGWQTIEAEVPLEATRRGPNQVHLRFSRAESPRQVFPDPASRAEIGTTGVVSPVSIDVHAFSEAYISAFLPDGSEVKASVGRRGYNVAVFDANSGRLLDQQGFDTEANAYEATALVLYLQAIDRGSIVVLATRGDGTANATPELVTALRGMGSFVASVADLAGRAQAMIGVQGAEPGTAAEAIEPIDAFVRVSGDFRTLAAAVDWVELGP